MFTTRLSNIERQRAGRTGVSLTAGQYFALGPNDANVPTAMAKAFAELTRIERDWLEQHPSFLQREWHSAAQAMEADPAIAAQLADAQSYARQTLYEFLNSRQN